MTILIKGMEMPDNCYGCPLSEQREETDMGARFTYMVDCKKNSFDDGTFEGRRKTRPDWCPLIEVPTPHGRLIDADAIFEQWYQLNFDRKIPDGTLAYWNVLLGKAPTVIEAEEDNEQIRIL